jgi:hypothetical protein
MRTHGLLGLIGGIALTAFAGQPVLAEPPNSVFRLQVLNESGTRHGTAFVIRRERRGEQTDVVLVTSARLFERESGRRARLLVEGHSPVEIGPDAISTPYANMRDVAILKATTKNLAISALPITFEYVPPETLFVISGLSADWSRTVVAQHVRFCATRAVLGDRATGELAGCQGAPAIVESGVFGVVSECGPDRVPEITPLSVSRNFLLRTVPGIGAPQIETTAFHVEERDVVGPELTIPIGDVREGELEVPLHLSWREAVIGASARLVSESQPNVADVTVLELRNRAVKLRFALGGGPAAAPVATAWPAGRALVLVRLNVVVVPKL